MYYLYQESTKERRKGNRWPSARENNLTHDHVARGKRLMLSHDLKSRQGRADMYVLEQRGGKSYDKNKNLLVRQRKSSSRVFNDNHLVLEIEDDDVFLVVDNRYDQYRLSKLLNQATSAARKDMRFKPRKQLSTQIYHQEWTLPRIPVDGLENAHVLIKEIPRENMYDVSNDNFTQSNRYDEYAQQRWHTNANYVRTHQQSQGFYDYLKEFRREKDRNSISNVSSSESVPNSQVKNRPQATGSNTLSSTQQDKTLTAMAGSREGSLIVRNQAARFPVGAHGKQYSQCLKISEIPDNSYATKFKDDDYEALRNLYQSTSQMTKQYIVMPPPNEDNINVPSLDYGSEEKLEVGNGEATPNRENKNMKVSKRGIAKRVSFSGPALFKLPKEADSSDDDNIFLNEDCCFKDEGFHQLRKFSRAAFQSDLPLAIKLSVSDDDAIGINCDYSRGAQSTSPSLSLKSVNLSIEDGRTHDKNSSPQQREKGLSSDESETQPCDPAPCGRRMSCGRRETYGELHDRLLNRTVYACPSMRVDTLKPFVEVSLDVLDEEKPHIFRVVRNFEFRIDGGKAPANGGADSEQHRQSVVNSGVSVIPVL